MKITQKLFFILMAGAVLLGISGCVGPKIVTNQPSSSSMLQPIPPNTKLYIRSTCDDDVADSVVQGKLTRALRNTGKFAAVEYGTATPGSLQLDIEIRVNRSLWGHRAFNGDFTRVRADGSLMADHTTLVTLHACRSGSGGLFGAGGWMASGEDGMVKSLMRWVIQDVADYLKSVRVAEK